MREQTANPDEKQVVWVRCTGCMEGGFLLYKVGGRKEVEYHNATPGYHQILF